MVQSTWHPIATAPSGIIVRVKCESHPEFGVHTMEWNPETNHWEGMQFGVMGARDVWWDENAPQPTHWQDIEL